MRASRIAGNLFLAVYLPITLMAFLFTVLRQPIFLHPRFIVGYSYGMMAPYQSAVGPHGQIFAECQDSHEQWNVIDLAQFYPQMYGERSARELFAMYPYLPSDQPYHRTMYAKRLRELLNERDVDCVRVRLSWDNWPAMTGAFDVLHLPAFTTRYFLYEEQ